MKSRTLIGQAGTLALAVTAFLVACGGSSADPILNGAPGSSSGTSGTSGGTNNCENVDCAQCPTGTRNVAVQGQCCGRCEPLANLCEGGADSCQNRKACSTGYDRFEYAPGCCECRLSQCAQASCTSFNGCQPGEHVDLAGCCPTCVKDAACNDGSVPCSSFVCPVGYKPSGSNSTGGPNCCSSCEPDPSYCSAQRQAFEEWLETRLAQPGALDCTLADDCQTVNLSNNCHGSCGTAVAKSQASNIVKDVKTYGEDHCMNCPPITIGCPAVVLVPRCGLDKKCTFRQN